MQPLRYPGFLLRPLTLSDTPSVVEAVRESSATVGAWMTWAHANYAEDDARQWIDICDESRKTGEAHEFGIFQEDGTTLVGAAGLNQFNKANNFCNLGYWVRQSAQRQRAATGAVVALSRYALDSLHLSRVEIVMAIGNTHSFSAAKRAGAVHECRARYRLQLHGKAVDADVFSITPPTAA